MGAKKGHDCKPGIEHKIRRFNERKARTLLWAKELSFDTEKMQVRAVCRWGHEKVYTYDSFIKGNSGNRCNDCWHEENRLNRERKKILGRISARKNLLRIEREYSEAREAKKELFFELLRKKEYSQLKSTKWKPFIEKYGDSNMMFILNYISYFITRGATASCPLPTPDNHFWCYDCQTLTPRSDVAPNKKNGNWCYSCYRKWRNAKKPEVNIRNKDRYYSDPAYRLTSIFRVRLHDVCKNREWGTSIYNVLNTDRDSLIAHLENQFEDWMNWDNYGSEWHVHHIIPLAKANGDVDLIKRLFHHKNLMPLSAEENLRIQSNIVPELLTDWHYKNFSDIL